MYANAQSMQTAKCRKTPRCGATCISRWRSVCEWTNVPYYRKLNFPTTKLHWRPRYISVPASMCGAMCWHVPISLYLNNSPESCRLRQLSELTYNCYRMSTQCRQCLNCVAWQGVCMWKLCAVCCWCCSWISPVRDWRWCSQTLSRITPRLNYFETRTLNS